MRQVGIFNADGSGFLARRDRRGSISSILAHTWAPDGKTLLINEFPENESRRDAARKVWSIDVATGDHTEVGFPVANWQRLAP